MENFIEYQRFSTLEEASYLTDILDVNKIPFRMEDLTSRFDLDATNNNPLESAVILRIREEDKEKVDKLNHTVTENSPENDHYMYSLSDNDIIDAVVNPESWTTQEQLIAQKIFKQRNLKPTAELIKSTRVEKIEKEEQEKLKQEKIIKGGASWFLWIASISVLNLVAFIFQQNVHFLMGLGINISILGIMNGIQRALGYNLMTLGYVLAFLFTGFFFYIWKRSKEQNKSFYLIGLIIYGLDTILSLLVKDWYSLAFHVFVFIMLYGGYAALRTKVNETKDN